MYCKIQLLLLGPLVIWSALSYGATLKTHEYILSHPQQRRSAALDDLEIQRPPRFPARSYSFDPRPNIALEDLIPLPRKAEKDEDNQSTTIKPLEYEEEEKNEESESVESSTILPSLSEEEPAGKTNETADADGDGMTGRAANRMYSALDSIAQFMPVKLSHTEIMKVLNDTIIKGNGSVFHDDEADSENAQKSMAKETLNSEQTSDHDDEEVSSGKEVSKASDISFSQGNVTAKELSASKGKDEPRGIVGVSQISTSGVSYIIHPDNLPPPTYKPMENLPPPSHAVAEWRPDIFMKVCCSEPENETASNDQAVPAALEVKTGYAQVGTTSPASLTENDNGFQELENSGAQVGGISDSDSDTKDKIITKEIPEDKDSAVSVENVAGSLKEVPLNMTGVVLVNETASHAEVSSNHTPRYEESGSPYQDVANFLKDIASSEGFKNAFLGDLIKNFGDLDQNAMKLIYSLLIRPLEGSAKSNVKSDRTSTVLESKLDEESDLPDDEDFVVLGKDRLPLRDQPANGYLPFGLFPQRLRPKPGGASGQIRPSSLVRHISPVTSDKDWRPVRTHPRLPSNGRRGDEDIDVITAPPFQTFEVVLGSSMNHDESKPLPDNLPGNRWGAPPPSSNQNTQSLPFKKLTLGLEMPPPDALEALPPGSVLIPPSQILNKPNLPHIFTRKDGTPTLELPLSELQPNLPFFNNNKPPRFRPPTKPQVHDIPPRLPSFLSSLLPQLGRPKPPPRVSSGGPVAQRPFIPPGLPDINKSIYPHRQRPTGPPPIVTKMTPPGISDDHRHENNFSPSVSIPHRSDADDSNVYHESMNPSGMHMPGPVQLPDFLPVPPRAERPHVTPDVPAVGHVEQDASHQYISHTTTSLPHPHNIESHHTSAEDLSDYASEGLDYNPDSSFIHVQESSDHGSNNDYVHSMGHDYNSENVYVHAGGEHNHDSEIVYDHADEGHDYNSENGYVHIVEGHDHSSENAYIQTVGGHMHHSDSADSHDMEEHDHSSENTYVHAEEGHDPNSENSFVPFAGGQDHNQENNFDHDENEHNQDSENPQVVDEEGNLSKSENTYYGDVPLDYILEYYDYRDYYDDQLRGPGKPPEDQFDNDVPKNPSHESEIQDFVENEQGDISESSYSTSQASTIFDRSALEDILIGNKPSMPTPTLTEQEKDGLQMLLQNHRMANVVAEANGTVFNMVPDHKIGNFSHSSVFSDASASASDSNMVDPNNENHYMVPISDPNIGLTAEKDYTEHDTSIAHLWNNIQLIPLTPELFEEPEKNEDTMNLTALFNDAVPLSPDLAFNEIPNLGSDVDKISIDKSDGRITFADEVDDSEDAKFMAYILIGACCGLALLSIAGVIVIVRFKKTCGSRQIRTRTRLTEQDSIENISRRVENLTLGNDSGHKLGSWFTGRNEHLGSGKLRSNMTLPTVHDFKRGKGSKSGSTRDLLSISSEGSQLSSPRQEHRNGDTAGRNDEEEPRSSWLHDEYRASMSDLSQAPGQDLAYVPRQYQQSRSSLDNAQPSTSHADHSRYRGDTSLDSEQIERSVRERRHTGQSRIEHDRTPGRRRPHIVSSLDSEDLDDKLNNRYTTDSEVEDWTTNYEDESREPSRYMSDSRELDETVARRIDPISVTSQELGDQLSRDLKQYQSRLGGRSDQDRRDSSRNPDSSQEVDVEDGSRELHRSQSQVSFSRDNVQNEVFLEFDNIFRQHGQYLNGEAPASTLGRMSRATEDTHFSASRANSPDSIDLPEPNTEDEHLHHKDSPPSPPTTPPRFSPPPPPPRPPKPGHLSQPGTPSPRLNRARPPSPSQSPPSPPRNQRPVYWTSEEERLI